MSASGANVEISYVRETTRGVTPTTPTMKVARVNGRNLNRTKGILRSAQINRHRMRKDVRHGFRQVGGTLPFELSVADFDDFIEGELGGTWAAVSTGTMSLGQSAPGVFTRATGSFISDGFKVGDQISTIGFTPDADGVLVTAVTASTLTAAFPGGAVQAAGAGRSITVDGMECKVGNTMRTFTFERRFTDAGRYQQFMGCAINNLTLNVTPEAIVGGSIDILGMDSSRIVNTTLGTPLDTSDNKPFDSFTGTIFEGGIAIGTVTGFTFTMTNNRALRPVLMRKTSADVYEGQNETTGTLTAHFEDGSIVNKFDDETETSVDIRFDDIDGTEYHRLIFPRVIYTGASFDPPTSGPVEVPLGFEAVYDSVTGSSLVWQRSNLS